MLALLSMGGAFGATLQVGPTRAYTSVADALDDAADGDVIEIDAETYGFVVVTKDVTLRGMAPGQVRIEAEASNAAIEAWGASFTVDGIELDGMGVERALSISGGGLVTVRDSRLANGFTVGGGGCVSSEADELVLESTVVEGCVSDSTGGGIFQDGGTVWIGADSVLQGNEAHDGSALYVFEGSLTLEDVVATANENPFGGWSGIVQVNSELALRTSVSISRTVIDSNSETFCCNLPLLLWGTAAVIEDSSFEVPDTSWDYALDAERAELTVRDSVFRGPVDLDYSETLMERVRVCTDSNWAGISADSGTLRLTNTAVIATNSDYSVYLSYATATLDHSVFSDDRVYSMGDPVEAYDSVFWGSSARLDGGNAFHSAYVDSTPQGSADQGNNGLASANVFQDPSLDCDSDLRLRLPTGGWELVGAGVPGRQNLDGTPADIGIYGGPNADPAAWVDGDDDGAVWAYDCDDADADRSPMLPEDCDNGIDDDCDGTVDETDPSYRDDDGDRFGDASDVTWACEQPEGYASWSEDCDDDDPNRNPMAQDVCDGIDNDCWGGVDEGPSGLPLVFWDQDGDGSGVAWSWMRSCLPGSGWADVAGDCVDWDANRALGLEEVCDAVDNDCDDLVDELPGIAWYTDEDGDGYGSGFVAEQCSAPDGLSVVVSGDCNDTNDSIHPGQSEICDAIDQDCDGVADEGVPLNRYYVDSDEDGFGDPDVSVETCFGTGPGYVTTAFDCDPDDASVHPLAEEICNGVDDDCNGGVDDGVLPRWYRDEDEDGYGDASDFVDSCGDAPDGYVAADGDCADGDANVNPSENEVCNGADDDCDGLVDVGIPLFLLWLDADGDTYGSDTPAIHCGPLDGYANLAGDCDDDDDDVHPDAAEACNEVDDDCNGGVDDGLHTRWYRDGDEDAYGDASDFVDSCEAPVGHVAADGDCDDADDDVHPDAIETCNDSDDDCDGSTDDGLVSSAWYEDRDGDGYGDVDTYACAAPPGWVEVGGDCDDDAPMVHPSAAERCNALDDDCDLFVDDGLLQTAFYADADEDGFGDVSSWLSACAAPAGFVADATDCDDENASVAPDAAEVCGDGIDNDCADGDLPCFAGDGDGDGYCRAAACPNGILPGDCDDDDASRHPGATELCDGIDQDCDAELDEGLSIDGDGDGHYDAGSCLLPNQDCDDQIGSVHPGAAEICDGLDNDCDGSADEALFIDADGDGFEHPESCPGRWPTDCDDGDDAVHPGAAETDNDRDDNCNDLVDEPAGQIDGDGDGYCSATTCLDGSDGGDCDDTRPDVHPNAREVLDGVDNDCNEGVDDAEMLDADLDDFTAIEGDCNDVDGDVFPDAPERCNGLDDDCDGYVAAAEMDEDGDGWRSCGGDCDDRNANAAPWLAEDCSDGADNDCDGTADLDVDEDGDGSTTCAGDCRDSNPAVFPGAFEECNGEDDDCDGTADESYDLDGDRFGDCAACADTDLCDCNDENRWVAPDAPEICDDGIDNDCDGSIDAPADRDLDGWSTCEGDCDDSDPYSSPASPEVCNGDDDDCDGFTDEGSDSDQDGWTSCAGDCADADATSFFGAVETCDARDEDCDTEVDDGLECDSDTDADDGTDAPPDTDTGPEGPGACFCTTGSPPRPHLLLWTLVAAAARRRVSGATTSPVRGASTRSVKPGSSSPRRSR